ncbi:MAG: ATP phosphoribosyltransferase [Bosea sp. (in: a-proteobacteria)]
MSAPLILAVPSKGRLQENAMAFFARAGLTMATSRGARDYRGGIEGLPGVEVAFLSASEIVSWLARGEAHLGVTGEDLVREHIADADAVELLTPLGFGQANVVVAAPQAWIDVRTMADLDDVAALLRQRQHRKLRVATKYVNLTRRYFAQMGVADYRIVESLGATEGAPAAGTADVIVDITTTGQTLAANALKVLEDGLIFASEANLVASLRANWTPENRQAAAAILSRIAAEEEGRRLREVRAGIGEIGGSFAQDISQLFGARMPFGEIAPGGIVTLHCPRGKVFELAEYLALRGARDVTVRTLDYVYRADNPLLARLEARLRG